jgi:hypothetical protein
MTDAYVIQVAGRTAGIVARDQAGQAYYFFAASHAFHPLEGLAFEAPHQAERAVRGFSAQNNFLRGASAVPRAAK